MAHSHFGKSSRPVRKDLTIIGLWEHLESQQVCVETRTMGPSPLDQSSQCI